VTGGAHAGRDDRRTRGLDQELHSSNLIRLCTLSAGSPGAVRPNCPTCFFPPPATARLVSAWRVSEKAMASWGAIEREVLGWLEHAGR